MRPQAQITTHTLTELWEYSGKRPFKARLIYWREPQHSFTVTGQSPIGPKEFYGYLDNGHVVGYQPNEKGWVLIS